MKKIIFLGIIVIIFIGGSVTSSTLVNATNTIDQGTHQDAGKTRSSSVITFFLCGAGGVDNVTFAGTYCGNSYPENFDIIIPIDGTISNLVVKSSIAPSVGQNYTMTVIKNGVDTPLTCTISNLDKTCKDFIHKVSVTAQDTIIERIDPSASSNSTNINTSVAFTPQ